MSSSAQKIPREFLLKRVHSLAGIWLVIYLIMHLFTNSQAALLIGDDGSGFIHAVNSIHELPYLPFIEIGVLGIPIIIHALYGIHCVFTAKYNSFGSTGHTPYLPQYSRNHAYTWQRITSWLLVVGILAHVVHMRFIEYPNSVQINGHRAYMMRVSLDDGLYTLAKRLNFQLYNKQHISLLSDESEKKLTPLTTSETFLSVLSSLPEIFQSNKHLDRPAHLVEEQQKKEYREWIKALEKRPLKEHEVIAVADNFGTVELLMVRDTFKSPIMIVLYTLLVLTACYHAFNGLWTAMITWGITISHRSQRAMSALCLFLMVTVALLGLSAVWLTYWINLKQ